MFIVDIFNLLASSSLYSGLRAIPVAKLSVALVAMLIVYRIVYALFFSPLRNIPGPFLSRLTSARTELINAVGLMGHQARANYLKYGKIYVVSPNAVAVSEVDDLRLVLGSHTLRKSDYYRGFDLFDVQTTLSARDPDFVDMRKRQLGPYFNKTYLGHMEPTILRHGTTALKSKWDGLLARSTDGTIEVNFDIEFALASFDIIVSLAYGQDFGCLRNNDRTVEYWMSGSVKRVGARAMFPLLKYFPFSLALREWDAQFQGLSKFYQESLAKRQELLESGAEKPTDLLQAYIDAHDPRSKTYMTATQVQAETVLALAAGSHATGIALTWITHLLLLHPDAYARATAEVRDNFGADHTISYTEAKKSLPYVGACIYEALRLSPTNGGMLPRLSPPGGVTLQGHFIPPGMEIYVNFAGASIQGDIWNEPLKFDPTRFLDDDSARHNIFAFSSGIRICAGRHLAHIELWTIVSNMLKDFDWSLPKDFTHLGPNVLDENGYPKMMDYIFYTLGASKYPERDCRLILTKHT